MSVRLVGTAGVSYTRCMLYGSLVPIVSLSMTTLPKYPLNKSLALSVHSTFYFQFERHLNTMSRDFVNNVQ